MNPATLCQFNAENSHQMTNFLSVSMATLVSSVCGNDLKVPAKQNEGTILTLLALIIF